MKIRFFYLIVSILALTIISGCTTTGYKSTVKYFSSEYGRVKDLGYSLPAIPIRLVNKKFHRQIVEYGTVEKPGTIIVDTPNRFLYLVQKNGKAVRYGIGVGRAGFSWEGTAYVAWKQAWPRWRPPVEMAERDPRLRKYVKKGMRPGLRNPLGARALYLYNKKGEDTLFRLHGTPLWRSIGTAASSGCIRLMNQDIIDLYNRVKPGRQTKVIVLQ